MTDTPLRQLKDACAAMECALRKGNDVQAASWLAACPALSNDDDLAIELIYAEYVGREAHGLQPRPADFIERYAKYAPRLKRLFEVDGLLLEAPSTHAANETLHPTPSRDLAGITIPGYTFLRTLGCGGMGVVWHARQHQPAREVAVKLLKSGGDAAAMELVRFQREASAIAALHHPNIITIFNVGTAGSQSYYTMQYVADGDLRTRLHGQPQAMNWSASLVVSLARAVQHAHDHGIIHRDLKPGNVLMLGEIPKLSDFGLAVVDDNIHLTRTGQVIGTLAYVAPEQAAGQAPTRSVDIYALGAILYECLTGRPPVLAETDAEMLRQVLDVDPISPRKLRPDLAMDLDTIVMTCLRKNPASRYVSASDLADDLERFQRGEPIRARPFNTLQIITKWAKRRPTQAALLGVSIAAVASIALLTWNYTLRLERSLANEDLHRKQAETARDAEAKRTIQSRVALDKLAERLLIDGTRGTGSSKLQLDAFEELLISYEQLAADSGQDHESRAGVVKALSKLARVQLTLNRVPEALATYRKAVDLASAVASDFPDDTADQERLAGLLHDRGRHHFFHGQATEAVADHRKALSILNSLPDASSREGIRRRLQTQAALVADLHSAGDRTNAEMLEADAEALLNTIVAEPNPPEWSRLIYAGLRQNRGSRSLVAKRWAAAEKDMLAATSLRIINDKPPTGYDATVEQARCFSDLGRIASIRKDPVAAAEWYRKALGYWEALSILQPNAVMYHRGVYETLSKLNAYGGTTLPLDAMDTIYARCRQRLESRAALDPSPEIRLYAGGAAVNHSVFLLKLGRPSDAKTACEYARHQLALVIKTEPEHPDGVAFYRNSCIALAQSLHGLKRFEDALKAWDEAIALAPAAMKPGLITERAKSEEK